MKKRLLIILSLFIIIAGCSDAGISNNIGINNGTETGDGSSNNGGGTDTGNGNSSDLESLGISVMNFGDFARTYITPNFPQSDADNIKILVNDNKPINNTIFDEHFKNTYGHARGEYDTLITNNYILQLKYKIADTDIGKSVEVYNEMMQTDVITEDKRKAIFNALKNSNYYTISSSSCGWTEYNWEYICKFYGINQKDNVYTNVTISTPYTDLVNETYDYMYVPYRNYKNLLHIQNDYKWSLLSIDHTKFIAPDYISDKQIENIKKSQELSPYPINTSNEENINILASYLPTDYDKNLLKVLQNKDSYGSSIIYDIKLDNNNPNNPVLTFTLDSYGSDYAYKIYEGMNKFLTAIRDSGYYTNIKTTPNSILLPIYNIEDISAESDDHNIEIYLTEEEGEPTIIGPTTYYKIFAKISFKYDITTAPTINDIKK